MLVWGGGGVSGDLDIRQGVKIGRKSIMLQLWVTVTTVVNTALGVVGLGVAVYAV